MKFYRAVVVDNNDPSKTGKVKIKIFGEHEKTNNQKTLPWAEVMLPSPGLIGGVGFSSVIKNGTWVYCIKEDDTEDRYVVLGVATGIVGDESIDGYKDPNGEFPLKGTEGVSDYGHCSITNDILNNEAKSETTKTSEGVGFQYTNTVSPTKYLTSSVFRTATGIMLEFDDGDKKLKITHPSGTTIELLSDGRIVTVAQNDVTLNCKKSVNWNILKDWNMFVDGDVNWKILGHWKTSIEKETEFTCNSTVDWKVIDDITWRAQKNVYWKVSSNVDWEVKNDVKWNIKNSVTWDVKNNVNWDISNNIDFNSNASITYKSTSDFKISSSSTFKADSISGSTVSSIGPTNIIGSPVNLN